VTDHLQRFQLPGETFEAQGSVSAEEVRLRILQKREKAELQVVANAKNRSVDQMAMVASLVAERVTWAADLLRYAGSMLYVDDVVGKTAFLEIQRLESEIRVLAEDVREGAGTNIRDKTLAEMDRALSVVKGE
jgi:hypothetical protein